MRTILTCLCFFALFATAAAAADTMILYLDGALFQQEVVAQKGTIHIPLAAGLLEQTLTVTPAAGTTILSVETEQYRTGAKNGNALELLMEQRRRLEDRLQALETREAIFTAAAKAQSGKAPRKTKANPEPLTSIRQGTDFAIAQLEAVYTARRTTTQEMRKIDARLAAANRGNRTAESFVRITVTPARGKVTLRYATDEHGWRPQYHVYRMSDGLAKLQLSARITAKRPGFQTRVSAGSLAESRADGSFAAQNSSAVLASHLLPLSDEHFIEGVFSRFTAKITNTTPQYLPSGDASLFRNGTYLGKFRFEGISSGRSRGITVGK